MTLRDQGGMVEQNKRPAGKGSVKFVVYGWEMLAKKVKPSGNSGRIYLPPTWVGKRVKIVRED